MSRRGPRSDTTDEFDKLKDSAQKLRAENRKLKKENAVLRKEINRAADKDIERSVHDESDGYRNVELFACPQCKNEDVTQISAGQYLIRVCKSCGFKKRSKPKS